MTLDDLTMFNVYAPTHPAHGTTLSYKPGEDPQERISLAMARFEAAERARPPRVQGAEGPECRGG